MKNKPFKLKIANPCTENWGDMSANGSGRHCSNCNKIVIDFSRMSEQMIVEQFKNLSGRICGRFRKEQLQVLYADNSGRKAPWYNRMFFKLALTSALTLKLAEGQSQTDSNPVSTVQTEKDNAGKAKKITKEKKAEVKKYVAGKVIDKETRQALPNITVMINGTQILSQTDIDGKYMIELPADYKEKTVTISVYSKYYASMQKTFTVTQLPRKDWLVLLSYKEEMMIMGDISPE
jgi:hypothetical protein